MNGSRLPCFRGIAIAAGPPLVLFKQAPVAAVPIESQALQVGGNALRLDLAGRFEAAPREALTYTAESSDPSVVHVRIENGTLIAQAVGEGIATLKVTVTDSDGLSATLSFDIQAERTARSRWRGWRLILLEPERRRPVARLSRSRDADLPALRQPRTLPATRLCPQRGPVQTLDMEIVSDSSTETLTSKVAKVPTGTEKRCDLPVA